MQIPGSQCFVCKKSIGTVWGAVGCGQCEQFAHKECGAGAPCPSCGAALLAGTQLVPVGNPSRDVYNRAIPLIVAGTSRSDVIQDLRSAGLDERSASDVVHSLIQLRHQAGRKAMWTGGLTAAAGIVVTAVTYATASGGGTYVIAWGAILFGGMRFFRGLTMFGAE